MRATIPLAALLALGCATTQGASEHATHDDPNRRVAGEGVEPPQATLAFLNVLEGPVAPEAARGAVASVRPRVQGCLSAISIRVEGHVVVRLEVDASGEVSRSGTDHVDGLDPEVVFCIVRAMRAARMPAGDAASVVRVGLDFTDSREVQDTAQPEVELADVPDQPVQTTDGTTSGGDASSDEEDEPPPEDEGFDRDG